MQAGRTTEMMLIQGEFLNLKKSRSIRVSDCEVKSNISLLDSESVYLPIEEAKTQVPLKRPMTAPSLDHSSTSSNSPSFIIQERPRTGYSEKRPETRYEAYDRRPIKPLNQNITKGSKNFGFSPPQRSGSEPAVGVKKQTPPTAMSQDYDTSIEPNNSDQENIEIDFIPSGGLSLIKDIAGSRKAQVLTKQNNDSNKMKHLVRSCSLKSASTMCKPQSNYKAEKYFNTLNSTESSGNNSTVSKKKSKDLKKESTLSKDSGFLSQPSSEALCRTSSMEEQKAATSIQAFWKGHRTRQYDLQAVSVRKEMRARHAEEHIVLLKSELEKQRLLHEEEKRLRGLQMEAIRSLWHEVQSLQLWKNEVLNYQVVTDSQHTNNLMSTTDSNTVTLTQTADSSVTALLSRIQTEKQQNLQQTCASLQTQVCQLRETVDSLTSMQNSGSIGLPEFEETDVTSDLVVTTNFDVDDHSDMSSTGKWSSIPHSLSPYPSEEEDQYFQQVPEFGVPTPPRGLKLQHRGDKSLILHWQKSKLLDSSGKTQHKNILGYRIYVNEHCQAMIGYTKTKILITGLSPNTIYKFYIKALSGLGESYESNIIMAKLAVTQSTSSIHSSESDSIESEKEIETSTRSENIHRKHNKRRMRKERSPRSPRSPRTHNTSNEVKPPIPEPRTVQSITDAALSLITQPKLHKHRRTSSRDNPSPDNTDSEKRLSTGSERSANVSTTSNRTDSSLTSPGRDSSSEQKISNVESVKPKYFQALNLNESSSTLTGTAMSETFTVDRSHSYLRSHGKTHLGESDAIVKDTSNKDSFKTHRRSTSKDLDATELRRTSDLSPTEKYSKDTLETSSEAIKTHRRKRSKDFQYQLSDLQTDSHEDKKASEGQQMPAGVPVIDGSKRHSSGSRPNSPMCEMVDNNILSERKRVPVSDMLEKGFLNINRTGTQGSRDETHETIPHRKLPSSPKGKGQMSPSPGGSREDLTSSGRRRTTSSGSEELNSSATAKQSTLLTAAKVLQKLQLFSESREKKIRKQSKEEVVECNQVIGSGRIRRISDSDCDQSSDAGVVVPTNCKAPAPSDSSGSHSDDSRPKRTHKTHRRTPSDQSGILSFTPNLADRPAHSPIIMDGSTVKKSSSTTQSSTVKRHSSCHSLLPPKHYDKSASGEDLSKPTEESESTANKDLSKKSQSFRSRSPSPITSLLTKPAKLSNQQGKKSKFFSDILS